MWKKGCETLAFGKQKQKKNQFDIIKRNIISQRQTTKWAQGYDIITNEPDGSVSPKQEAPKKKVRIVPVAQVDYNIITNDRLDDIYFQNVRYNGELKKVREYRRIFNFPDICEKATTIK